MTNVRISRKAIAFIVMGAVVLLLGGILFFSHRVEQPKHSEPVSKYVNEQRYFSVPESVGSGIPKYDRATNIANVRAYSVMESVVDGSDSCTVYQEDNKQILAEYSSPGGMIAPGKQPPQPSKIFYKNPSVTQEQLEYIFDTTCFKLD